MKCFINCFGSFQRGKYHRESPGTLKDQDDIGSQTHVIYKIDYNKLNAD